MAAAALDGDKVTSSAGEDLGKIEDIMLDVGAGLIACVVLSSGGFLGIGSRLLASPWSALTLDTKHKCFLVDMTSSLHKKRNGIR